MNWTKAERAARPCGNQIVQYAESPPRQGTTGRRRNPKAATDQIALQLKAERLEALADEILQMYAEQFDCEIRSMTVICSGRILRTTYGRYDAGTATITIYNHSGNEDEETNTLIHECAHHLQYHVRAIESGKILPQPGQLHGATFHVHYHRLVQLAKKNGYYNEPYLADPSLKVLIDEVRAMKRRTGDTAIRTGELLSQARDRCQKIGASFELFIRDGCDFHRSLAYDYIKAWELKLPADLGVAKLRFVLRVPEQLRNEAIQDIRNGTTSAVLKIRYRPDLAKSPSEEEVKSDPAAELTRLRVKERQLRQRYAAVKKRRIELETSLDSPPKDLGMSTNSTFDSMASAGSRTRRTQNRERHS